MRFRQSSIINAKNFFVGVLHIIFACGARVPNRLVSESPSHSENRAPTFHARGNEAYIFNREMRRVEHFTVDPLTFLGSTKSPLKAERQSFWVGRDDRFLVFVGDADFAIVSETGVVQINPVEGFADDIIAGAYNAKSNSMAMSDGLGNVGVFTLEHDGTVAGAYVGGVLAKDHGTPKAFDVTENGFLVAGYSGGRYDSVDISGSIQMGDFSTTSGQLDNFGKIQDVISVPGGSIAYIVDNSSGATLDTKTFTIVDKWTVDGSSVRSDSRGTDVHSLVATNVDEDESRLRVFVPMADGAIVERDVTLPFNEKLGELRQDYSYYRYSKSNDRLALALNSKNSYPYNLSEVNSFELFEFIPVKGRTISRSQFNDRGQLVLSDGYFLTHYPSAIGSVRRTEFGRNGKIQSIQKFNLPFLKESGGDK